MTQTLKTRTEANTSKLHQDQGQDYVLQDKTETKTKLDYSLCATMSKHNSTTNSPTPV